MKYFKYNVAVRKRCNKSLDIWSDKVRKTGNGSHDGLPEDVRRDVEALGVDNDLRHWDKIAIDYHTPKEILKLAEDACCSRGCIRYKVVEQNSKRKVYSFYCLCCGKVFARKVVLPYKVGGK